MRAAGGTGRALTGMLSPLDIVCHIGKQHKEVLWLLRQRGARIQWRGWHQEAAVSKPEAQHSRLSDHATLSILGGQAPCWRCRTRREPELTLSSTSLSKAESAQGLGQGLAASHRRASLEMGVGRPHWGALSGPPQGSGKGRDWRNRQEPTEVTGAWREGVLHRVGHAGLLPMALCSCSFQVTGRPVSPRGNRGVSLQFYSRSPPFPLTTALEFPPVFLNFIVKSTS